jgi:RND family efflux transporter, MFP subunit
MPSRRHTAGILIALVIAGIALGFFYYRAESRKPLLSYETVKVDQGRIVAKVTATGTLSALVTVQVGSQVSGRIQQIFVDFNSPVKKGQLIAKIDPRLFEAAVEQARANSVAAQANLTKAKAEALHAERQYRRTKALAQQRLIAQVDVDTAQTNVNIAQAQVEVARGNLEQARAALHHAQTNLAYTDIVSPTNGIVIARNVDVGQTVAASLQAPTLFLIAEDLSKMQVDTHVAEADIGKLRAGMVATFTVDAYPSERFTGIVRQIRNAPQTVQNVVTYDAVINVDNTDLRLKPGMTSNVTFVYAEKEQVLRVSNAALRFRPPPALLARTQRDSNPASALAFPDRRMLWVLQDDTPKPIPIRIGISDGTLTEVVEGGVRADDLVITAVTEVEDTSRRPAVTSSGGFRRIF